MPISAPIDEDSVAADTPPRRAPAFSGFRRSGQVVLALGAIALLAIAAREGRGLAPSPVASEAASAFVPSVARGARAAVPLALSAPRYRLDDPDSLEPVQAEAARLNPATGHREDVLVQGGFSTIEAPYLRLTLTEAPEAEPAQSLFVTLARRAADGQGLAVIRTGERGSIPTKFGPIETLDITLGGEGRRTCTGFASLKPGSPRLDGWLCAPLGQAPEPRAIRCALDKVALNGQASPDFEAAFAALEAARDATCRPPQATERDAAGATGSLPERRTRKNEAKLRPSREAQP